MLEKLIIALISGVFCSMLTALIGLLMTPKLLKTIAKEAIEHHVAVFHQDSMYKYVEGEIKEHADSCQANNCIDEVKKAVFWLVEKQGGNIMEIFKSRK